MGISKVPITCFIEPDYASQKSKVDYSFHESGNKDPVRELKSGTPITWVWVVTTTSGFEIDKANFYVYAKFKMANQESDRQEVSKSEIEFKESPFDGIYTFYLNHLNLLNVLLTLVTALISLWVARIGFLATRKTQAAAKLSDEISALHLELKEQRALLDRTQSDFEKAQSLKKNLQVELYHLRRRLARLFRKVFRKNRWRKLDGVAQVRLKDGNLRLADMYLFEPYGTGNNLIITNRHYDQELCLGITLKPSGSRSKSIEIILIC